MQSYRHPAATWKPSPNFTPNRHGHEMAVQPAYVTLHTMVCCEASAWGRFQQASQQASSTYGVKLDGSIVQYVDEKDAAWTNGTSSGVGAHDDSITIEHEDCGDYDGPRTPELYRTSALLVREICTRYGIPIDRAHVIKHRECSGAATACPDALDVDRIVRMAADTAALPGDEPMYSPEDIAAAVVIGAYIGALGRAPENQAAIDGHVRDALQRGVGPAVAAIVQSAEAGHRLDTLSRLLADYEAGHLGAPGPPGPPGPAVTDEHILEVIVDRLTI